MRISADAFGYFFAGYSETAWIYLDLGNISKEAVA